MEQLMRNGGLHWNIESICGILS